MPATKDKSFLLPLEKKVFTFLIHNKISKGSHLGLAYSAGSDSSALLWALARISAQYYPLNLEAFYVNHHLRPDYVLRKEILLAQKACAHLNVPLNVLSAPTPPLLFPNGIEHWARLARYSALGSALEERKTFILFTAHTLTDSVENELIGLLTGRVDGSPRSPIYTKINVLTPFEQLSRKEIKDYLKTRKIRFSKDRSNEEKVLMRSKIRFSLLPLLLAAFPGVEKAVSLKMRKEALLRSFLTEEKQKLPALWSKISEETYKLENAKWSSVPPYWRFSLLCDLYDLLFPGKRLSFRRVLPLLEGISKTTQRSISSKEGTFKLYENTLFFKRSLVGIVKNQ